MKIRLFIFLLVVLCSCTSSRKVVELQNEVENLENTLSDEKDKNRILSSLRFFIDVVPCVKGRREVKQLSENPDSLCIKYSNLLDKYQKLQASYIISNKNFNTNFMNLDSVVSRLRTEYNSIKKSSK